jgi:hypothetical protein
VVVGGDLQAGDSTAPHCLYHLVHDVRPPGGDLWLLHQNGCVCHPIPCELVCVLGVSVYVLLSWAVHVEVVVDGGKTGPHSSLLRTEEGVLWEVDVVQVVQLFIPRVC